MAASAPAANGPGRHPPSPTRILARKPSSCASQSMVALSVSTSASTSPGAMAAPSFLRQCVMLPCRRARGGAGRGRQMAERGLGVDGTQRGPLVAWQMEPGYGGDACIGASPALRLPTRVPAAAVDAPAAAPRSALAPRCADLGHRRRQRRHHQLRVGGHCARARGGGGAAGRVQRCGARTQSGAQRPPCGAADVLQRLPRSYMHSIVTHGRRSPGADPTQGPRPAVPVISASSWACRVACGVADRARWYEGSMGTSIRCRQAPCTPSLAWAFASPLRRADSALRGPGCCPGHMTVGPQPLGRPSQRHAAPVRSTMRAPGAVKGCQWYQ
jgi:hypothetical protein